MAYESTTVDVSKSQGELRDLLSRYGAEQFGFREGTDPTGRRYAAVEFIHDSYMVRVAVPLKDPDAAEVRERADRARKRTREQIERDAYEQEARRIWRVLVHGMKARMVAIEEGVETFQQAFLPFIVDPGTGHTVWESLSPAFSDGRMQVGGGGLRALEASTGGRGA